jgi:hypothetical protein
MAHWGLLRQKQTKHIKRSPQANEITNYETDTTFSQVNCLLLYTFYEERRLNPLRTETFSMFN